MNKAFRKISWYKLSLKAQILASTADSFGSSCMISLISIIVYYIEVIYHRRLNIESEK